MVRELGLERCETVRSLSATLRAQRVALVREDRATTANGDLVWAFTTRNRKATLYRITAETISSGKAPLHGPGTVKDYYIGAPVLVGDGAQAVLLERGYSPFGGRVDTLVSKTSYYRFESDNGQCETRLSLTRGFDFSCPKRRPSFGCAVFWLRVS